MSASIYVFITLTVSTQATHLNTLWAQTLVKTLVCLSAPVIVYSWNLFVLSYCLQSDKKLLSIFRTCSCLHDYRNGRLVSVHFQMNYLLFHLQNQRQYRYCQSPNHIKHYSKLTSLFTLLLIWCLWLKIVEDCTFMCILRYSFFPSAT